MEIRIYGAGCAKCRASHELIARVVEETSADVTVTKVEDLAEIAGKGILSTPGIEVDGEMKMIGKVPTRAEVLEWIGASASA